MTAHQLDTLRWLARAGDDGVEMGLYLGGPVGYLRAWEWARVVKGSKKEPGRAFITPAGLEKLRFLDEQAEAERLAAEEAERNRKPEPEQMGLFGGAS